jgi:hypothetical protein
MRTEFTIRAMSLGPTAAPILRAIRRRAVSVDILFEVGALIRIGDFLQDLADAAADAFARKS